MLERSGESEPIMRERAANPSGAVLDEWLASLAAAGHRAFVVLAGERAGALEYASRCLAALEPAHTLTISDHPAAPAPALHHPVPGQLAGREFDAVVVDAHAGFDADTLGAVSGTVRGGGLLILCCPELAGWPDFEDPARARFTPSGPGGEVVGRRYLRRFARLLARADGAWVLDPANAPVPSMRGAGAARVVPETNPGQRDAVEAVRHVVTGQRRRPVVLYADRGRGKSAALGLAAAELLRQGTARIVVCAVSRSAVDILFRHARESLHGANAEHAPALRYHGGVIEYVEPSRLMTLDDTVELVLVDEAAALPLHWLERALRRFPRIAFATTVHGYEGSGRGFATRFTSLLDRHTRGWRRMQLVEPVRYSSGDPLERLMFEALMLNAEAADLDEQGGEPPAVSISELDRDALLDDEDGLRQFFALLVSSHYRTRPNDLRYLLDGADLSLVAAWQGGRIVAAAVVAREGGIDDAGASRIRAGRSRPRGHMLSQTLCAQLGESDWLTRHGLRVVRIAVHPARRRRGIGTRLLSHIEAAARARGCDYLGSSFAVGVDVARFWRAAGFVPVWLSGRRNATSGVRSLLVARPLSPGAARPAHRARLRFLEGLRVRLAGLYADEAPDHVALMFQDCPELGEPCAADCADVARFVAGEGNFEACFTGLWRVAAVVLARPELAALLSPAERALLIKTVLQQVDPSRAGDGLARPGRRAVLADLAEALARIVPRLGVGGASRRSDR